MVGSTKSGDRRDAKEFLEDKLGPNDSALVILVKDADWQAVDDAVAPYSGTELAVEFTPDAESAIAALAERTTWPNSWWPTWRSTRPTSIPTEQVN